MTGRLLCVTLLLGGSASGGTLLFEDFEDATVTYSVSPADDLSRLNDNDYYGRLDAGTGYQPNTTYGNLQGSGYYGAQDTFDATVSTDSVFLTFGGVNIAGVTNLGVDFFAAEGEAADGNEDWDSTTSFQIFARIDGAAFQQIFGIESEVGTDGNQTNEKARVDSDLDGIGDGAELTDSFSQFFATIAGTGSTLDVVVAINDLNAADEDVAFDSFQITGDFLTGVPEPSAFMFLLLGAALGGAWCRVPRE